ncbi:hypothetical protein HDV05_008286 [Chytridiales sp. JEL 0842]|nr:hypothetical protein HDV05_008286 [Chytridiales sp. JEL 0842]
MAPSAQLRYVIELSSPPSSKEKLGTQTAQNTISTTTTTNVDEEKKATDFVETEQLEDGMHQVVVDDAKTKMEDDADFDQNDEDEIPGIPSCSLCFEIPNRAKSLSCCGNRIVCSLCIRNWLKKHATCPFCRTQISAQQRKHGLPDAKEAQAVLDDLEVFCPYEDAGCPWIPKQAK